MPYHWQTDTGEAPVITGASLHDRNEPPLAVLHLSAHNSLTPKGFVTFVGITCALVSLPLLAVLGTVVLWALLPFVLTMLGGLWWALTRSWADKAVTENLTIWTDRVELHHRPGRGTAQSWIANSYWVTPHMHARRGAHRNYITLTGGGDSREVELGAFLTEDERRDLFPVLRETLAAAASVPQAP